MKKIIPFIVIVITILQLFAPFSVALNNKNIEVNNNKAEAINIIDKAVSMSITQMNPDDKNLRDAAQILCLVKDPKLATTPQKEYCFRARWVITGGKLFLSIYTIGVDRNLDDDYTLTVKITNPDGTNFNPNNTEKDTKPDLPIFSNSLIKDYGQTYEVDIINEDQGLPTGPGVENVDGDKYDGYLIKNKVGIAGLLPNTNYSVDITLIKMGGLINVTQGGEKYPFTNVSYASEAIQTHSEGSTVGNNGVDNSSPSSLPACGIDSGAKIMGCVAQGLYYLLFKTTSFFFGLAGKALDFTLMYSLSDTSYRSDFVVQGWGIVRDFCNMFFIFVLLYVAFGTILNLHGVKTKEMIINVVIIGLLMNFSLFATRLIIDTSNILARVFYNQNTISVGEATKDSNGNVTSIKNELGDFGEIRLSEAIVSKVDPQKLIIEAQKVDSIQIKGAAGDEDRATTSQGITTGSFILIVLLTTAINIVGIIAFLTSCIIFISRVIGLWLAMILVPLAFFSYTVPALQNLEMVGWKHWWPDTLKLAFLAPVFTFFMYIIVGFMNKGLGVVDASNKTGLNFVVAIMVPFVFIMILLMKSKEIAVKLSGEIGRSITSGIQKVGGVALGTAGGAALGLGAGVLRGTVGRLGNKLATSEFASTSGAVGRGLGNVGKWASSGSMDLRGVKIAGKGIADTGLKVGKAKEGGYKKHLEEKVEKRQKRAKELEVHESEPLKQALNSVEKDLQDLLRRNSHNLETLDKRIKAARENVNDASLAAKSDPTNLVKKAEAKKASDTLAELKEHKAAIRGGKTFTETFLTEETPGSARGLIDYRTNTVDGTRGGKTINNLDFEDIPHAHAAIEKENRDRKWAYAEEKSRWGGRGEKEAAHKIRMESKLDAGEKSH